MASSPRRNPGSGLPGLPPKQGMYNPAFEKDACGLAMVATLRGEPGHDIIALALTALRNLEHRGAIGSDAGTGDGAGILTQMPDAFLRAVVDFELPPVGEYAAGMVFLPVDDEERAAQKAGHRADRRRARTSCCSAGARFRPRTRTWASWRLRPARCSSRSSSRAPRSAMLRRCRASSWTAACTACASGRVTSSTPTSCRCRAGPSATRAWSRRSSSSRSTRICRTTASCPSSLSCTRATRPTPSRPGLSRSRCGCSLTTARSTPSTATATGCGRASRSSSRSCWATCAPCCPSARRARATRHRSTRCSSC